jgi:hypothetical protein
MNVFPSIRIEGGLLGPDVLDQLIAAELLGQKAADFGFEAKRNLNDEIAAVFADTRALWGVFQNRLARLPETDVATSLTREMWMIPFLNLLGYSPRFNQRAFDVDGLSFAISHRADEAEDAPPLHIVGARQELGRIAASGRPRLSPHALVQEFLNRTEHLWGLVSNGVTLRLLRDSTFVRRQSYVEFDLAAILEEQRFQDFAALYRLLHRSRLPRAQIDASECLLEKYYSHSVEQGDRVRDRLRDGVEDCLQQLANGFLRQSPELRQRTHPNTTGNERINAEEFYRQLLRLVYRFLFLLVSEDRGLISPDPLYREHYGVARLRRLLESRAAYTEDDDLWQSLRVVWKTFSDEKLAEILQLAPLNGELFAPQFLDSCAITNRDLLAAFWRLAWYEDDKARTWRRVNYAALDVEELGSVYESLLEFHPHIEADALGRLSFQLLFGSERKTTGSYYTPPQLVNELIQSALEPVIADRINAAKTDEQKAQAILSIRVCDPACGSGHFLLAAARRLGKELARIRTGEDEPAPERLREATREVIAHCIYGVDRNPLAVDLCRVALWLESHTGGKPLTFLDHRIRCGDSLVGVFDLAALKQGIPDKAFEPLTDDDKTTAREMTRRNRDERGGQRGLFDAIPETNLQALSRASHDVDAIGDDSPAAIREKKRRYEQSHRDPEWLRRHEACNLWTAAFFQPFQPDQPVITSAAVADCLAGQAVNARVAASAMVIAERERFFHWPLEFPEVFAAGGFDVILSNPPWEHVELKEQEFFAARDARIATAPNKAARAKLIRELPETNPALHREFGAALRAAAGVSQILRHGGRYPLTGRGDINTYAVFAELARKAVRPSGRAGIIVPSGIATDDTTKFFFGDLAQSSSLVSLFDFENRKKIFAAVDSRMKFALLTMRALADEQLSSAEFVFFALDVDDLRRAEKRFTLTADEIALLNPNTGNCPIFRTQADAELAKAIYRRVPVLWREAQGDQPESNPWRLSFKTLFHMANDSHHFRTAQELEADGYKREGNVFVSLSDRYLPLYEAKMLHQFDHRWATYEERREKGEGRGELDSRDVTLAEKRDPNFVAQPRYWVREEVVESAIPKYPEPLAQALALNHKPSIQRVLCYWAAGQQLLQANDTAARTLLDFAVPLQLDRSLGSLFARLTAEEHARQLAQDFPLSPSDLEAIAAQIKDAPEAIAETLVERFSPKWFLGWRRITNTTNERTLISFAFPKCAAGDSVFLIFIANTISFIKVSLFALLNSFVLDFSARQKLGGTNVNFFVLRQFPILGPEVFTRQSIPFGGSTVGHWVLPRALELSYTSQDLEPLARDCTYEGPPFAWDEARRFELRCELDAAFFHLYLPSWPDGQWRPARLADGAVVDETAAELAALKRHFATPRDAVAYILDQFPIVRQKDEAAHGRYRTKERILEIYDAMQAAQRGGRPYQTSLSPLPYTRE